MYYELRRYSQTDNNHDNKCMIGVRNIHPNPRGAAPALWRTHAILGIMGALGQLLVVAESGRMWTVDTRS